VEEKTFPANGTDLKTVARWCYDWRTNAREKFQNNEKLGAKFVCTTSVS